MKHIPIAQFMKALILPLGIVAFIYAVMISYHMGRDRQLKDDESGVLSAQPPIADDSTLTAAPSTKPLADTSKGELKLNPLTTTSRLRFSTIFPTERSISFPCKPVSTVQSEQYGCSTDPLAGERLIVHGTPKAWQQFLICYEQDTPATCVRLADVLPELESK